MKSDLGLFKHTYEFIEMMNFDNLTINIKKVANEKRFFNDGFIYFIMRIISEGIFESEDKLTSEMKSSIMKDMSSYLQDNNKKVPIKNTIKQITFEKLDSVFNELLGQYRNNKIKKDVMFEFSYFNFQFLISPEMSSFNKNKYIKEFFDNQMKFKKELLSKENETFPYYRNTLTILSEIINLDEKVAFYIFDKELKYTRELMLKNNCDEHKIKCVDFQWEYIIEDSDFANLGAEVIALVHKYRGFDYKPTVEQVFKLEVDGDKLICNGKKAFATFELSKNVYRYDLVTKFLNKINTEYKDKYGNNLLLNSDKNSDELFVWNIPNGDVDSQVELAKEFLNKLIEYRITFSASDLNRNLHYVLDNMDAYSRNLSLSEKINKQNEEKIVNKSSKRKI